jgi:hypothetical protein
MESNAPFYEMLSRQQVTFPLNIIARHALSMRLETLRHGTRYALSEALAVARGIRHALFHEARAVALAVPPQAATATPLV